MATILSDTSFAKLPPMEAIAYLKQKGYRLTFDYNEMMHEAHHKAFTVAKINRLDLLSDIKEQIHIAQKEGLPFAEFKKRIKPTLIKKGWWGKIDAVNPVTGEVKEISIGTRRLKTIYYTNTRVAYMAGRAKSYYSSPGITHLKYVAILDNRVRPSHAQMNGIVLPKDHPFWETNFPPNGWNCRCRVSPITRTQLKRYQKKGKVIDRDTSVPDIAPKDWAYDVREGRFFDKFSGTEAESVAQSSFADFGLPSASEIKSAHLPPAPPKYETIKDKNEALEILKKEILGDKKEIRVKTPITEILFNEDNLKHIVQKDIRAQFAKFIKPTLTNPDEIWAVKNKDKHDGYFKKRYRFIKLFKEKHSNTLAISELLRDGSVFVTFIKINKLSQIDKQRVGILMYFDPTLFGEGQAQP